jgi:hypothetical protein
MVFAVGVHSSALVIAGAALVVAAVGFSLVARLAVGPRLAHLDDGRRTGPLLETFALVVVLAGAALAIYGWLM